MRPQPVGEGGCPGLGPSSWQSRSISALALRRWGKCAWSLLLSHRLGPMLLSRSAPGIGFVRSRQRFVRLRQATAQVLFINRRPRAGGANSRRQALPHGPVIDDIVDVLSVFDWDVVTPWWISSFVPNLEAEIGLALMFASMIPMYGRAARQRQ